MTLVGVIWLGVECDSHHGPGCAHSLSTLIDEDQVRIVAIEVRLFSHPHSR